MHKLESSVVIAALAVCCALPLRAQETATAKYKVNFYGQIKSDVSYDVHGVTGDDYTQYVASEKDSEQDFRASARGTRFGLDITDGDKVSAKIESDFLGVTDGASTSDLRIRHAYVTLKAGKFEVLSGQAWHLLPLEFSGTNNEFAMGYSGVLWMRAPQLRVTYKQNDKLTYAAAVVRPTRKLIDAEGTASGRPQIQAQAQLKVGKAKFTLMGALGQWRKSTGEKSEVKLVDLGYNIPLGPVFTLNGQLWAGQNLYDFLGGIGNMGYGTSAVKASGGFVNFLIKPRLEIKKPGCLPGFFYLPVPSATEIRRQDLLISRHLAVRVSFKQRLLVVRHGFVLYRGFPFVEPYDGVAGGGFMPAAQRAGIDIAYCPLNVGGFVPVPVKDQQRGMPAQQGVQVSGYLVAYGQRDLAAAGFQGVMHEGRAHPFELMLRKVRPGGGRVYVSAGDLVRHPGVMFFKPVRGAFGQSSAHPGVVVAGQQAKAGHLAQQFDGLGGPRADADGVAGMESGVVTLALYLPGHGLQGREVGVGIGENHYFHKSIYSILRA